MFVSRHRYERDMAALRADAERLRAERDTARDERDAFRTAAKTSAEQFVTADAALMRQLVDAEKSRTAVAVVLGEPLIEGGRSGRPVRPEAVALRERDRARLLERRLAEVQAANESACLAGEHA
ncbi:hypothetical protein ACFWFF_01385 [Streptomyces sp. NPDC060223]|uniref:hypothetical protein n=1 Tax=unclassified Streptomyces TaxID=2593676 RepID=UPI00362AA2D7